MSELTTIAWTEGNAVRSLKGEIEHEDDKEMVLVTLKKKVTIYKQGNIIKKEEYLPGHDNGDANGNRHKTGTGDPRPQTN